MARTHTYAARAAGAEVSVVASSSSQRAAVAALELNIPHAASVQELVEKADVVHVCSPNALHADHVQTALAAGKHVVCEKPLTTDAQTAQQLVVEAEQAGVVAAIPFVYRFHPMVRQARSHVAEGKLGRLLTVRGAYLQDWMHSAADVNWRVSPEISGKSRAFGDIGSHLVDLLEFVAGERIQRLSAATSIAHPVRGDVEAITEDAAALTVELEYGAVGSLMVSQVNAGRKNALTLELAGAESSIAFDQEHPDELWVGRRAATSILSREPDVLSADAARLSTVPAGHPMGYLDAFVNFTRDVYAKIRGDEPVELPGFRDGARVNAIIEAVLISAETKEWVNV